METKISSRFDLYNHPKEAADLVRQLQQEFKNSDYYPNINDIGSYPLMKYMDVIFHKDGENLTYYIYLNFSKAPILEKNGNLSDDRENKYLSEPHFLIRGDMDPMQIQIPFDNLDDAIGYLTLMVAEEVPVI